MTLIYLGFALGLLGIYLKIKKTKHMLSKILSGLVMVLLCVAGFSQNTKITVDRLEVKQSMKLVDKTVTSITTDSTLSTATHAKLPTAQAVKKYVDNTVAANRVKLQASKPNPLTTFIMEVVVDTVGVDSVWIWNASIYRLLQTGGGSGDVTRDELADSTAAIRADFLTGVLDSSITWANLTQPVKDSIQSSIVNPKWLYVSKATGNNATAQKGNAQKPYADPFAAADDAIVGDEIFVSDGVWWYGVGSEFDPYSTPGLLRNGIVWHFSQGTKINTYYNLDQYNNDTLGLLFTTETVNCKILGQLDITLDWDNAPVDAYEAIAGFSCGAGSNIKIELDSLYSVDLCLNNTDNTVQGFINITIDYSATDSGYGLYVSNGQVSINLRNSNYFELNAKLNSVIHCNYNGISLGGEIVITADTTGKIFLNSNSSVYTRGNGEFHINQTGGFLRIQNAPGNIIADLTDVNLGGVALGQGSLYIEDNCKITIKCTRCYTNDSIYIRITSDAIDRNPRFILTGDIDLRGGSFHVFHNAILDEPDFKGLIFKDLLLLNPNPSKVAILNVYPFYTLGLVMLNVWSNLSSPVLGFNQHGEPMSTY